MWHELTQGIVERDWKKAEEGKKSIEKNQREMARERKSRSETWDPIHFATSYCKEKGWDCSPLQSLVPVAPIVVPITD